MSEIIDTLSGIRDGHVSFAALVTIVIGWLMLDKDALRPATSEEIEESDEIEKRGIW